MQNNPPYYPRLSKNLKIEKRDALHQKSVTHLGPQTCNSCLTCSGGACSEPRSDPRSLPATEDDFAQDGTLGDGRKIGDAGLEPESVVTFPGSTGSS